MFLLMLCIFAILKVQDFLKIYKRIQKMKKTPTTDIRYLDSGQFEVKARISSLSKKIESPLSQSECVWYSLIIKELVKQGKSSTWKIRANVQKCNLCIIDDGTGTCQVDLSQIDFDLGTNYKGKSGTFDNPTTEEQHALTNVGLDPETFFGFNKTLQYEEYILREGDELYLLGNCKPIPKANNKMLMQGTPEKPLFVSDKSEAELIKKYERKIWGHGFLIFIITSLIVGLLILNFT